jgi:HEAT repeat protein
MISKRHGSWVSTVFLFAWTGFAAPARELVCPTIADSIFATDAEGLDEQAGSDKAYPLGQKALEERHWDKAVEAFDESIQQKSSRSDGALYWKAYAQNKLGQRDGALQTLQSLSSGFPKSRWLGDAKALEIEIRGGMGQPVSPDSQADEDLKLMAINALISSDPERALPILQKMLQGNQSPKIKEKALFILAQSGSAPARELLTQIARGNSNPDLQMKALNYLGLFGGNQSRQTLAEIYKAAIDTQVKRQILRSYMVSGDREQLLALAKGEKIPELRRDAIQQLGVLSANEELWSLYQADADPQIKESVLKALFVGGDSERLIQVARSEKDPKLRGQAIQMLGTSGAQKTGEVLVSLFETDTDASMRKRALNGLFIQGNVKALIQLAKKETNPEMKKEIVGKLSLMNSKEAIDYMMEILNK